MTAGNRLPPYQQSSAWLSGGRTSVCGHSSSFLPNTDPRLLTTSSHIDDAAGFRPPLRVPFVARQRQDPEAGAPDRTRPIPAVRGMPPNASPTDVRWVSWEKLRRDGCSSARNWNRPTSADVASMVCSSDRYLANGIVAIARVRGWTKPRLRPAVSAPKPRLLRLRRARRGC